MKKKANRLINEKSPYLLQHAYNPVDWHPWGDEAFEKAKREDKPVFLSSGYSTCHWCHVMERESFEDEEVARILNDHFFSIKLDREERPDVDRVYMEVCQALTGSGGWPLTIIMTPDKTPFFAGTYFPKQSMKRRPGLLEILSIIQEKWETDRKELMSHGQKLVKTLQGGRTFELVDLNPAWLELAFLQFAKDFDAQNGGFGNSPKFPSPHNLLFLLRYWHRTRDQQALFMVEKTLNAMRRGGIYDHIGYGFARYSVDNKWLIPHFEKMLYDNALLCHAYLEAYQCTGDKDYSRVAEEIITYVLRRMTDPQGGFYSAEDADSEGVEGKFYVWTRAEIIRALGQEAGTIFADFYNITEKGNFEKEFNVLNYINTEVKSFAEKHELSPGALEQSLRDGRMILLQIRERRHPPLKDDKVLTAWNALMIAALAKAARVLNRPDYMSSAQQGLDFIFHNLFRDDGRLLARFRDGNADYPAYLDDYAFLIWALLEVYETTFSPEYLSKAQHLNVEMQRLFADEKQGGFFFSAIDNEILFMRSKELYDGAMPSGNSIAMMVMIRLARYTNDEKLLQSFVKMMSSFAGEVSRAPRFYPGFLMAMGHYLTPPSQIIIAGQRNDYAARAMLAAVGRNFLPTTTVLVNDPSNEKLTRKILPDILPYKPINGRPAAYVCENFSCQSPYTEVAEFLQAVQEMQVNTQEL